MTERRSGGDDSDHPKGILKSSASSFQLRHSGSIFLRTTKYVQRPLKISIRSLLGFAKKALVIRPGTSAKGSFVSSLRAV